MRARTRSASPSTYRSEAMIGSQIGKLSTLPRDRVPGKHFAHRLGNMRWRTYPPRSRPAREGAEWCVCLSQEVPLNGRSNLDFNCRAYHANRYIQIFRQSRSDGPGNTTGRRCCVSRSPRTDVRRATFPSSTRKRFHRSGQFRQRSRPVYPSRGFRTP